MVDHSLQSAGTCPNGTATPVVAPMPECLYWLGLEWSTTQTNLTYGLNSTHGSAYRDSEKGPLDLHFLVPCGDTQAGSHPKTTHTYTHIEKISAMKEKFSKFK